MSRFIKLKDSPTARTLEQCQVYFTPRGDSTAVDAAIGRFPDKQLFAENRLAFEAHTGLEETTPEKWPAAFRLPEEGEFEAPPGGFHGPASNVIYTITGKGEWVAPADALIDALVGGPHDLVPGDFCYGNWYGIRGAALDKLVIVGRGRKTSVCLEAIDIMDHLGREENDPARLTWLRDIEARLMAPQMA